MGASFMWSSAVQAAFPESELISTLHGVALLPPADVPRLSRHIWNIWRRARRGFSVETRELWSVMTKHTPGSSNHYINLG
ncbi:unnamed protein product [Arctogadus glacialis]